MTETSLAEHVLILAPLGRDGAIATALLAEAGIAAQTCADLPSLAASLARGAGAALVTQEAVRTADLHALASWVAEQPAWSDFPFIVATERGGGPEHNPGARRLAETLGNVTLLERPFHPYTLVSVARSALRSRRRQYQSRAQLLQLEERRQALAEAEQQFRMLADNIPVLAWTADASGWIFWYNSRWYEYTGTQPADMQGWGWRSVHDPATLPSVMERWTASITSGSAFEMVFPLRRADGEFRPFLTRISPVFDAEGRVARWFGTNVDISAERTAEAAVRASEERLRFALAAGRLGSWELDVETKALTSSSIFRTSFGHADDVPFGFIDLMAATHAEDRAMMRDAIEHSVSSGSDYAVECRVIWPDQSLRWIELRGQAVRAPGRGPRMIGVSRDITARKTADAELSLHRERLEELVEGRTRELGAALDQLQTEVAERERTEDALRQSQKMEAIGQLTGGIAHDFNNLLTGIVACVDVMQIRLAQGRTQELGRYVIAAKEGVARAASLTHRLLAFARRQTLERRPVDANKLATGMEELLRRTVTPAIEVELVLGGGLWMTFCDGNQLENALLNLCINARDAMADGGRLVIETANARLDEAYAASQGDIRAGQYVMLSVTDTGIGMSASTISRAFDPFFTTKPIGQGTGLGLSMVYGFVKQSEGHVRIYSEEGHGTTVRVYLPRYVADEQQAPPVAPEPEARREPSPGVTVLVVEDEAIIRALVVETLDEQGYDAIEAADGPQALRLLEARTHVDLLLTDVGLPGMNGRQLAEAARVLQPDLKVLFMTGYAHNAAIANGMLEEGMQLVTKPFALDALAARVRAMIDAGG